MKPEAHARWLDYIEQLAKLMGLCNWSFGVDVDKTLDTEDPPVAAKCRFAHEGHHANIILSKHFMRDCDPDEQRLTIVHELVHCHLRRISKVTDIYLESQTFEMTKQYMSNVHHQAIEDSTEDIAAAWCVFLPLPPSTPFTVTTPDHTYRVTSQVLSSQPPDDRVKMSWPVNLPCQPYVRGDVNEHRPVNPNGIDYPVIKD